MKNKDITFNLKSVTSALGGIGSLLKQYSSAILFVLFMGAYGYMIFQINILSNPAVDHDEVVSQAKKLPAPRIDEDAAKKLQSLKDNSVNVQTLFEQGRTNPFDE